VGEDYLIKRDTQDDFAESVDQTSAAMLRVAFLLTGQQAAAEDLLQTALERLYVVWDRLDTDTPPTKYLRRIIYTTHVDRRGAVGCARCSAVRRPSSPSIATPTPTMTSGTASWRLVQRLAPMQRAVIVLRFYEDLPEAKTAQILGISAGSVKVHSSRGMRRLREMVHPSGHQSADPGGAL
jgi:RNA polymerase sigma-70 factor (sigma-E family)